MKSSHDQVYRYLWAMWDINLVLSLSVLETSHSVDILHIQNFAESSVQVREWYCMCHSQTWASGHFVPFILEIGDVTPSKTRVVLKVMDIDQPVIVWWFPYIDSGVYHTESNVLYKTAYI